MAERPMNPGDSPCSSEETRMEEPVVSREPAQADVVVQPNTTCAQCKKEVKSPHLLCCLHSVCVECLPGMAVEGQRIKCGECGDTSTHCSSSSKGVESQCGADIVHCVPVPNGPLSRYMEGAKVVEKASLTKPIPCEFGKCKSNRSSSAIFCVDCWNFMCERCSDSHDMFCSTHSVLPMAHLAENIEESCALLAKRKPKYTCSLHQQEPQKYFCKSCSQRFCQVCTTAGEGVTKHSLAYINPETDSFDGKSSLLSALSVLRGIAGGLEAKCESVEEELQGKIATIEEHKDTALREMNGALNVMQEALDKKRDELHRLIIATAEDKKRAVVSQLECVAKTKQCCTAVHPPASLLQTSGSAHDLLASKDLVQTHQSVLTSKWCEDELENTVSSVLRFEAANQEAVLRSIEGFGIVTDGACPEKCTVEPKPDQVQLRGSDPVPPKVVTFDSKGIACTRGWDKIDAFLCPKPPTPGPAIKARVVDNDNGTYSVSFPSVYPGPCVLSIEVNGRDIRGSPFDITLPRRTIQGIKGPKGHLQFPQQPGCMWGVAISSKGTIVVSDNSHHKIHVFNKERKYVTSFGTEGSGEGQLSNPRGLTVDSDGLVYVASYSNYRIEVFREDGTFVRQIGSGQLNRPWNVTIHNQQLYIANNGNLNHGVSVYTLQGQHVRTFGSKGKGPGQLSRPSRVALSPDGDMYVTDYSNHRVQVFDAKVQYKREFGQGQLQSPMDIVITSDGDVLVADSGNNRVAVYSTCGNTNNLIHSFEVQDPRGLTIDKDGDILVTEYINNNTRVLVF